MESVSQPVGMAPGLDYEVLIIGAGLSGVYSLIRMRALGMRVKVLEVAPAEGGTWYWNRYPGARFDSESYTYGLSFSQELLQEWHWKEHYSPQPETLKYIQFICDKFDLRGDIQFNTLVKSADYRDNDKSWELVDANGNKYTTKFLITALGPLNTPTLPNIAGINDYKGISHHTSRWPHEPVDFENKKVGVVGTGATGIQTIQTIAKEVGSLTVFQRTANWSAPLRNSEISIEEMESIRRRYPEIFKRCKETPSCFVHAADPRKTLSVPPEEREVFWEELYAKPGFAKWLSNFGDIFTDEAANDAVSEFFARKIRERVKDPKTAEKLVPKDHGFGTRRLPLETFYFEVYNQPNVKLIDLRETPIECITETGIQTSTEHIDLDMIIYATGFDAITGAYDAIDITGVNAINLKDWWKSGPKTFLGMTVENFPNLFMIMGPHQIFGNTPRSIEYAVEWVSDLIEHCQKNHIGRVEATADGVEWWTQHVYDCAEGALSSKVDSWMTGINTNVAGKQTRTVARYNGTATQFRTRCDAIAADKYISFKLAA